MSTTSISERIEPANAPPNSVPAAGARHPAIGAPETPAGPSLGMRDALLEILRCRVESLEARLTLLEMTTRPWTPLDPVERLPSTARPAPKARAKVDETRPTPIVSSSELVRA